MNEKTKLKKVSEEDQRKKNKDTKLSTNQRIEVQLASIARNLNLVVLAMFGISTGVLGFLFSNVSVTGDFNGIIKEVLGFIMMVLLSAFLFFVNSFLPHGALSSRLWGYIKDSHLGERINKTLTGGNNRNDGNP